MYVELTTGKDSFRAVGAAPRRNCGVFTYGLTTSKDAKGVTKHEIVPLFVAYKNKLKGFGKTSLVQTIPATDKFGATDAGQWFVNRHEVMPGTEILIEYKSRNLSGFSEKVEYLLIVPDDSAPLYRIRVDLPSHPLSSVPSIFFEGRFKLINSDDQLDPEHVQVWKSHLGLHDDEFHLSDILDPTQDEQVYNAIELEGVQKKAVTARVKVTAGKQRIKISRTRRIKTR